MAVLIGDDENSLGEAGGDKTAFVVEYGSIEEGEAELTCKVIVSS